MRSFGHTLRPIAAAEALGTRHDLHVANYGEGIQERLTGQHETASWREFSYGVSHRGASVRGERAAGTPRRAR